MNFSFKEISRRKWFRILVGFLCLLIILFLVRKPIMRGMGNYLIYENELEEVDVIVVLSGGAYDRGLEAAKLYDEEYAPFIICPGGNQPPDFKALGIEMLESELTREFMIQQGVPESSIEVIPEATSTLEEADVVLDYLLEKNLSSCIIVSSRFHTRRVKNAFKKKLQREDITVIIHGAPSSQYEESSWWENEYGMLAVNNEYVKLIYHLLK